MDRLLRPKVLEIEPTHPNAEKLYRDWKTTFENYLNSSLTAVADGTPGDDASLERARVARAENDQKKCQALVNNVSPNIWELINELLKQLKLWMLRLSALQALYTTVINSSQRNKRRGSL